MQYYVYAYIRSIDSSSGAKGSPYYIGKGKRKRAWSKDHTVQLPADSRYIVMLETGLSEVGAFALERRMIRWYGRLDQGTGILRNRTDGGDGTTNISLSEETKQKRRVPKPEGFGEKISKALTGRPKSNAHKTSLSTSLQGSVPWNKGKTDVYTLEQRRALSESKKKWYDAHPEAVEKLKEINTGKQLTDDHIASIKESTTGVKKTDEHRKNISLAKTSKPRKPFTDEHRQKMSESRKKYHRERSTGPSKSN